MNTVSTFFTATKTQFAKHVLLTGLAMFALISSYAQTTVTAVAGGGPWNNTATWVGGVIPTGTNYNAIIPAGTTVTVPANASCLNLTVNGTLTMSNTGITMAIGDPGTGNGRLTIGAAGTLTVGSNNFLDFKASQGGQRIVVAAGGTFTATGTNGIDAGTVLINSGSGADFEVTGNVNFYNIRNGSSGDGNWHLKITNANSVRINGTLRAEGSSSWGFQATTNAPIWGTASTFYADRANQGFNDQNTAWGLAWSVNAGTVGTTPGYPNNVTLVNMGASQGGTGNVGWNPNAGATVGLGGTLSAGDGTIPGKISLERATTVNVGGIVVNSGSYMVSPAVPYINRGNFTLAGGTTGQYVNMTGGTINFAGTATQTISTTGASVDFANMQVSNGTVVQLNSPVNITSGLTLTSGVIRTTAANVLTMSTSSNTAITGGSATAYVEGPLAWTLPATSSSYVYPVGRAGTYLPFTINPNSASGTVATVTAFNTGSGGSLGTDVTALSTTEYWSVSTSSPVNPLATAQRPTAVGTFNALGISTSPAGVYNTAGGSPNSGTPGIISNGGIGSTTPIYVAMIRANLTVVKLSSTNYGCNPAVGGSVTVGGSAGTPPYMYSVDGGAFVSSGLFTNLSAGDHTFRVRDAAMVVSAPVLIKVLGSVLINGDNKDILKCPSATTALTATNLQNATPTFRWSTSSTGTPVVFTGNPYNAPTATDNTDVTYYVSSELYTNNLITTNAGFESGDITGYSTTYTNWTGAAYPTTPGNNGYYSVSGQGKNQCTFFTIATGGTGPSLAPHSGAFYFIADGATTASDVLSLTINSLTIGNVYKFNYWYAAADPDNNHAQLTVNATGGTVTAVGSTPAGAITFTDATAWTQATYNVTATATSVTITLRNPTSFGTTNGNDLYLDDMEFLSPCTVISSIRVQVNCALPVELLSFNAVKQGQGALLTWATASEKNSAFYIIEKSSDGTSFESIGKVNAAGNSHSLLNYSFVDPTLSSGITYYRLAQYDIDGSVHYSDVRALQKEGSGDITIFPNPSSGIFEVLFDHSGEATSRITVINLLGQIVYTQPESAGNIKKVDISSMSAGTYYLQVQSDQGVIVKKIIKE